MPTSAEKAQVLWQEMQIISVLLSAFQSHPDLSELHPSSSAVSEEIHSNLVQMAVKNHADIKIT